MKKLAIAAFSIAILSTAQDHAYAQASMTSLCATRPNAIPCVRDRNNTLIGIPLAYISITRQINGTWYQYDGLRASEGATANGLFYYTGSNCSGQPYMITNELILSSMLYDGSAFFAPIGEPQALTSASYSYPAKPQRGGYCVNQTCTPSHGYDPCAIVAAPASKVETITFYPPFKMQ
jgi:hypothetical protein